LSFFFFSLGASRLSYVDQQVLKCKFDASAMPTLEDSLDVWGVLADGTVDIRVKTSKERELVESLLDGCVTIISDLESVVRESDAENYIAREKAKNSAAWFEAYHTLAELNTWYRDWKNANPTLISSTVIGSTYGGNSLEVYIISASRNSSKPIYYLEAGIHAREWVAPSTLNFVADSLITDYKAGVTQVVTLLNNANIHILPVVNPDGYLYTWASGGDRLWRKNRSPNSGSTCVGTDNNRNFNSHWNGGGSSNNPCSETFMGPSAGSERETQAISNYFKSIQKTYPIRGAIDLHSYSQLVLRPWGYTTSNSPNETYLKTLGDAYSTNVRAVNGRTYTSQKSVDLYVTSGSASDYWYDTEITTGNVLGSVTYRVASYTVELRPTTSNPGFQLPPVEIIPTGQENYAAIKAFFTSLQTSPVIKTN